MGRIVLMIAGFFLMVLAWVLLWGASINGRILFANAGLGDIRYLPRDVYLHFMAMFVLGYVFVTGTFLQNMFGAIASVLTGGSNVNKQDLYEKRDEGWGFVPKLVLGGFAYLFIAVLLGAVLQLFVIPDSQGFGRFLDPEFMKVILSWPYLFARALHVFGLPDDSF